MTTYLLKTEPDDYSFQDLQSDGKTVWDGVANNAALGHIRRARKGDEAFIYHTGNERAIVGLARITSNPYEDPANPGTNAKGEPASAVFDIKPLKPAKSPVTLATIKELAANDEAFANFALVRQARLSVMPVPEDIDRALRKMAGL